MGHLLVRALLICSCASIAGAQTLLNGDFEDPGTQGDTPAHWTVQKGTFVCDSGKRKTGSFSAKIDGGNHDSSAYQDVTVTPGTAYVLRGVWRNGDKTAPFDVARAVVQWLNAPGGEVQGQAAAEHSGDVVSNWTNFQLGPMTAPQ